MKKLLVILVSVLSITVFSQNNKFKPNKENVIKEFVKLLDSIRDKQNKGNCLRIDIDSMGSLAAIHHNKYMMDLVPKNTSDLVVEHFEKNVVTQKINHVDLDTKKINYVEEKIFVYFGCDTLFQNFSDRYRYFSKDTFGAFGECCMGGYINFWMDEYTDKDFANHILKSFKGSKEHWAILMSSDYYDIGIDLLVDHESERFWVTIGVGHHFYN